jgi:hypothetical protein
LKCYHCNLKAYYCEHVLPRLRREFPDLVNYIRFVNFIPSALLPLCAYFQQICLGDCTGVSFIDSTSLDVCLNQRIALHKVFARLAGRGKSLLAGFSGPNCTWSSMTGVSFSMPCLCLAMSMTASLFQSCA